MEPLKSIEEAADIWGVSPWTVRAYVRQGKIRPVRIGRRVLIEAQEIQRLIDEGRDDQPQAEKVHLLA
jgi:excisionase family DNA binding protein